VRPLVSVRRHILPLRPPEVSALQSVAPFPCPDKSLSLRAHLVGAPRNVAFFPTQQALARHLAVVHRPHARPRYAAAFRTSPPSCSAIRPGPQRLGYRNGGFISPASRPDAGRALGHGKCSVHDRECSPSSVVSTSGGPTSLASMSTFTTVPASPRGSGDTGDTGALPTADDVVLNGPSRAQTLICPYSAAPRTGEPFGGCASAGVVGREYPRFVAITHRHCIAPPHLGNATSRVAVAAAGVSQVQGPVWSEPGSQQLPPSRTWNRTFGSVQALCRTLDRTSVQFAKVRVRTVVQNRTAASLLMCFHILVLACTPSRPSNIFISTQVTCPVP